MIDANNLINNLRAKAYKKGYTFEELPEAKKARYIKDYNFSDYDAGVLTSSKEISTYFEKLIQKQNL